MGRAHRGALGAQKPVVHGAQVQGSIPNRSHMCKGPQVGNMGILTLVFLANTVWLEEKRSSLRLACGKT